VSDSFSHSENPARDAAAWLSRRLAAETWTEGDEERFREWLDRSPTHAAEYERARAALDAAERSPGPVLRGEIERTLARARHRRRARRIRVASGGLAAAAAAVLAIGVFVLLTGPRTIETGIAQRRSVEFSDGSVLHLDSSTTVEVDFSGGRRAATLDRGRVLFEVARDAERPFEVGAGRGRVRVLGTVFEVNLVSPGEVAAGAESEGLLEVAVKEGEVALDRENAPAADPVARLGAGQVATWEADAARPDLGSFPLESFGEWRAGRLVYRDRPFKYVLADLQRELGNPIVLADESLGEMPVSGTLSTRDMGQAFRLLADVLPITVRQAEDGRVTIGRRPEWD